MSAAQRRGPAALPLPWLRHCRSCRAPFAQASVRGRPLRSAGAFRQPTAWAFRAIRDQLAGASPASASPVWPGRLRRRPVSAAPSTPLRPRAGHASPRPAVSSLESVSTVWPETSSRAFEPVPVVAPWERRRPRVVSAEVRGPSPPRRPRSWGRVPTGAHRGTGSNPPGSTAGGAYRSGKPARVRVILTGPMRERLRQQGKCEWRDLLSLLGEYGCFRPSGRSPGSWAGRWGRLAAFPFPEGEQWRAGKGSHLQWRDRTGFQPVSLLSRMGPEDRTAVGPPVAQVLAPWGGLVKTARLSP